MDYFYLNIKKLLFDLLLFLSIYLMPIYETGIAILVLMSIDFLTGIMASKKNGKEITSNRMRFSIYKFISYSVAMITALIFSQHFSLNILSVISFFIASVEVKSIFENLLVINPKANLLKVLVDLLKSEKQQIGDKENGNL